MCFCLQSMQFSKEMLEFCSFCRLSSGFSNVVSLEGLEFNDRHGWQTLVIKILEEILPEVTDATAICEECLQTINNFYQLKRDLVLGFYKYGDPEEQNCKFIKEEFGEFSLASDFNCESIDSSLTQSRTFLNTRKPVVKLSTRKSARNKTTVARVEPLKVEKEDELLIDETVDSIKLEGTDVFFEPLYSQKGPLPLPSSELEEFRSMSEKKTGEGFRCSICSQRHVSSTKCYRHMVYEHSRNKKLLDKWIEQQIVKNSNFSDCTLCPRSFNSQQALRYHLFSHILDGEVGDSEFLAMRCDNKISKYYKPKTGAERSRDWRMKHLELSKALHQEYSKTYREKIKNTASQDRLLELRHRNRERQRKFRAKRKEQKIKKERYN